MRWLGPLTGPECGRSTRDQECRFSVRGESLAVAPIAPSSSCRTIARLAYSLPLPRYNTWRDTRVDTWSWTGRLVTSGSGWPTCPSSNRSTTIRSPPEPWIRYKRPCLPIEPGRSVRSATEPPADYPRLATRFRRVSALLSRPRTLRREAGKITCSRCLTSPSCQAYEARPDAVNSPPLQRGVGRAHISCARVIGGRLAPSAGTPAIAHSPHHRHCRRRSNASVEIQCCSTRSSRCCSRRAWDRHPAPPTPLPDHGPVPGALFPGFPSSARNPVAATSRSTAGRDLRIGNRSVLTVDASSSRMASPFRIAQHTDRRDGSSHAQGRPPGFSRPSDSSPTWPKS